MINDPHQNRKYVIGAIFIVLILIYIVRLFSLQVLETKYKEGAESNALLRRTLYAPRGLIYDRNGKLLVYNKSAYDITVIMREVHNLDTLEFCRVLKIDKDYFNTRMSEVKNTRRNLGYSPYTPQSFMTQLEMKDIADFQQTSYKFPGFYIQSRTLREYSYPNAAHVLGSIGEVSRQQIESDNYYRQGDYSGRDGLEYTYEKELRGEKGVEILLRDAKGRIKGKYEDGEHDIAPKSGENITLTLDIELQRLGEKLLNGKIGSIVAIEPVSGEILALVSNPAFDPSLLVGRERSKNYSMLVNDPTEPLFNRATQAQYPPGSTFKIIQALVCLDMGGITEHTHFSCSGEDSKPIKCTHWHPTPANVYDAIEQSCNPFFWQTFRSALEVHGYGDRNINFRNAYKTWKSKVRSFGLGSRFSDTDVYKPVGGDIPSESFYDRHYGETGWRALTIRSLSIGQGEILLTPLQLANVAATIANDGYYVTPHLCKNDSLALKTHQVDIDKKYFPIVKEGMRRMMENTRSGRYHKVPGITVGGKTGTTQNPHGEDHSLYIAFAPFENPQIAIAVVIENAGYGATWAMPAANYMMEQYLHEGIKRVEMVNQFGEKTTNLNVKRN